jgi:hypothetical protein
MADGENFDQSQARFSILVANLWLAKWKLKLNPKNKFMLC